MLILAVIWLWDLVRAFLADTLTFHTQGRNVSRAPVSHDTNTLHHCYVPNGYTITRISCGLRLSQHVTPAETFDTS